MLNKDRVINALTTNALMNKLMKRYEFYWQEAYHRMYNWLEMYSPEQVAVFIGKYCTDFHDNWSQERENLFNATMWIAEHLRRSNEEGLAFTDQTVEASIRRELGMPFMAVTPDPGHERPIIRPPDSFHFEDYLRKEGIEYYGLPVFIKAVEAFVEAFKDWCPRHLKVSERLIYHDFSCGISVLSTKEQELYGYALVTFCDNLSTYPANLLERHDHTRYIRNWVRLSEKPELVSMHSL